MTLPTAFLSARGLASITIGGVSYALVSDPTPLHRDFAGFFGDRVSPQDLIDSFERPDAGLTLRSLSVTPTGPDTFETSAEFHGPAVDSHGTCTYVWKRLPDGSLERTKDATLEAAGFGNRIALQIHGNLIEFCRKAGVVTNFMFEARGVGRYAYRFMDGVEIEPETLEEIEENLRRASLYFEIEIDWNRFESLKSPRDLSDFLILSSIHPGWMALVDDIIHRRGYQFTVDQVVDVVRRPGLALLLDRERYVMRLDLRDDPSFLRFHDSVLEGRNQEALQRLRGVLGGAYSQLPEDVRNALIVHRPYLFPRPKKTPPVPDLTSMTQPESPYRVLGFRSKDGFLLRSLDRDPPGTPIHEYRGAEVRAVVQAIEAGTQIVTATGLSGCGKTEVLIWNLERTLSQRGHRVVSLDAQRMGGTAETAVLLRRIDELVQPTVVIFDESVYISGPRKTAFIEFARRFLQRSGQHIVFVGGGVISPEAQRRSIEDQLEEIFRRYPSAHATLHPKPINLTQAYRYLGLARVDWADESAKLGLLTYILERYPPYFIPMIPIRLHEHAGIGSLEQARALIDAEADLGLWTGGVGMVIEGVND
ncbi:MAG TPA: hypothetical protein VLJ37_05775 [bacterium]|nr:hypothetical protein [bacterium]